MKTAIESRRITEEKIKSEMKEKKLLELIEEKIDKAAKKGLNKTEFKVDGDFNNFERLKYLSVLVREFGYEVKWEDGIKDVEDFTKLIISW